jgi:hypothetical protein
VENGFAVQKRVLRGAQCTTRDAASLASLTSQHAHAHATACS